MMLNIQTPELDMMTCHYYQRVKAFTVPVAQMSWIWDYEFTKVLLLFSLKRDATSMQKKVTIHKKKTNNLEWNKKLSYRNTFLTFYIVYLFTETV